MITGIVERYHALVRLTVRGREGREGEAEFVLDTGFTGFLTLPPSVCGALELRYLRPMPATLAGGNPVIVEVYEAVVLWDGEERDVEVLAMENTPLLGMLMLDGSDVRLQVTDGGLITIEAL